jgi:hypothetical protein
LLSKTFNSIAELRWQCVQDDACEEGLEWLDQQTDLDEVFRACPHAAWCLMQGYTQFDGKHLRGSETYHVMNVNPAAVDNLDLTQLRGHHWAGLVDRHPDLVKYCDWSKLSIFDWGLVLNRRPQFSKQLAECVVNGFDPGSLTEFLTSEDRDYIAYWACTCKECV